MLVVDVLEVDEEAEGCFNIGGGCSVKQLFHDVCDSILQGSQGILLFDIGRIVNLLLQARLEILVEEINIVLDKSRELVGIGKAEFR